MTDAEGNACSGSGDRLIRLLAMLAYLAEVGEATFTDLSDRFALDERSIVAELELAGCCGLPPYTPAELLELVVEDDRVVAFGLGARRPPRLTPDEGFALAASARAMLAATGATSGSPSGACARQARSSAWREPRPDRDSVAREPRAPPEGCRRTRGHRDRLSRCGAIPVDDPARRAGERRRTRRHVLSRRVLYLANDWRRFSLSRIRDIRATDERALDGHRRRSSRAGAPLSAARESDSRRSAFLRRAPMPSNGSRPARARCKPTGRSSLRSRWPMRSWFGRLSFALG